MNDSINNDLAQQLKEAYAMDNLLIEDDEMYEPTEEDEVLSEEQINMESYNLKCKYSELEGEINEWRDLNIANPYWMFPPEHKPSITRDLWKTLYYSLLDKVQETAITYPTNLNRYVYNICRSSPTLHTGWSNNKLLEVMDLMTDMYFLDNMIDVKDRRRRGRKTELKNIKRITNMAYVILRMNIASDSSINKFFDDDIQDIETQKEEVIEMVADIKMSVLENMKYIDQHDLIIINMCLLSYES